MLITTLVIMEGVGKQIAPLFDVFEVSGPYVRKFLIQLALPTSWGPEALRSLSGWAAFLSDLPGAVDSDVSGIVAAVRRVVERRHV